MKSLVDFLKENHVSPDESTKIHSYQMKQTESSAIMLDTATIKTDNSDQSLMNELHNQQMQRSNDELARGQIDSLEQMIAKYRKLGRDDLVKKEVAKLAKLRETTGIND